VPIAKNSDEIMGFPAGLFASELMVAIQTAMLSRLAHTVLLEAILTIPPKIESMKQPALAEKRATYAEPDQLAGSDSASSSTEREKNIRRSFHTSRSAVGVDDQDQSVRLLPVHQAHHLSQIRVRVHLRQIGTHDISNLYSVPA
jgi:hypothetical protein